MATDTTTEKSFADALRDLMGQHGLSFRELAKLTPAVDGKGLGHAYLGHLASGYKQPTVENMQLLARTFGVDPTYFSEYRRHHAQDVAGQLVEKYGADAVLAKLAELD